MIGLLTAVPLGWLLQEPGQFQFVAGLAYAVMPAVLIVQWRRGRSVPAGTGGALIPAGLIMAAAASGCDGRPVSSGAVVAPDRSGRLSGIPTAADLYHVGPAAVGRSGYRRPRPGEKFLV